MVAKGQGIITLDANGFKASVDSVKKGFNDIDRSATSSLNSVTQKSKEATQAVTKTGEAAASSGAKIQSLSVQVIGLGQAITSATSAVNGYTEKMIALNKQKISADQLTVNVKRAEEDLDIAIRAGTLSVQEITRKTEDLNFMRRNQKAAVEEITAKEKTMNNELIALSFSMVQTGFFGITTLTTVLGANQKAWIAAQLAQIGFSRATLATAFSMGGLRAAMTAVSSHPLMTIALVAAAAAMAAYETNILGFRDALSGLVGTELPTISQTLTNLTGSILPAAGAETEELTATLEASRREMDLMEQGVSKTAGSLDTFANSADKAKISAESLTSPSSAAGWAKYWGDRYAEINKVNKELNKFTDGAERLRQSGFSAAVIEAAAQGETKKGLSITQAIEQANRALIVALNLAGLDGGNAVTGVRNFGRIISGNQALAAVVAGLRLDRSNPFGHISSNLTFGGSSAFAQAFGGGPAFSTFGLGTSGFTTAGEQAIRQRNATFNISPTGVVTSSRMNSGLGGLSTVGQGGSASAGRSSKHGGSNRADESQRRAAAQRIDEMLRGTTGFSMQELTSITGLQLFSNLHFGASGRTALSGNFGSYARYRAAQDNIARQQDAIQKQVAANLIEVQKRSSLLQQLATYAGDPDLMAIAGTTGLKLSSESLQQILSQQQAKEASYAAQLKISTNQIQTLFKSKEGFFDIQSMLRFAQRTEREVMAATTV